jgi:predicted DNA binding protein
VRYLTGVLRPVERVHPNARALAEAGGVTQVALHQTRLLDDGTSVTWLQVRGDRDRLEGLLAEESSVLEYAVAGEDDLFVYLHSEPHDLARYLYRLRDEHELVVEMPLEFTDGGGLRGTVIGEDRTFQRAVDALSDDFDFEVERIGEYHPEAQYLFAGLTPRQREILATAVREGYYEDPRRASQRDLAETLELAPGTVSQALGRIEARVFSNFVLEDVSDDLPSP